MGTSCSTLTASPEKDCGSEHSKNKCSCVPTASGSTATTTTASSKAFDAPARATPCATSTAEDELRLLVSSLDAVTEVPSSDLLPLQHAQSDSGTADNDARRSPPRLPHFVPITALSSDVASLEGSACSETNISSQVRLDESGSFRGGAAAAAAAAASAHAKSTPRQVSFTFALRFDEHEEGLPPRECAFQPSDAQRVTTPLPSPATVVPLTSADAKHRVQQAVPKSASILSLRTAVPRSHRASPVSPKREPRIAVCHLADALS